MRCYAVDDEMHGIYMVKEFIERTNGLELVGWQNNPEKAVEEIKRLKPDIVFTDIRMPQLNGIALAGMVDHMSRIVFISGDFQSYYEGTDWKNYFYLGKMGSYSKFLDIIAQITEDKSNSDKKQ